MLLGLVVVGTIVGGDKGSGHDEPQRREIDWVKLLLALVSPKEPAPAPGPVWLPPYRMPDLPPIDLTQIQPPPSFPAPMETEDVLKALEREIEKEFKRRLKRSQRPVAGVRLDLSRRHWPPRPKVEFQMTSTRRKAKGGAREESFTEKLMRHLREPKPREETFSEKLLRHLQEPWPVQQISDAERRYQEPLDFRTAGEKIREARQAAAKRQPPRPQTSPIERFLA